MYTQLEQRGMSQPPVNVATLRDMKAHGKPIACLTAYDASYFGVALPEKVPMVTQDRAYTSAIWYTPGEPR